jgi:hypothetical protein
VGSSPPAAPPLTPSLTATANRHCILSATASALAIATANRHRILTAIASAPASACSARSLRDSHVCAAKVSTTDWKFEGNAVILRGVQSGTPHARNEDQLHLVE